MQLVISITIYALLLAILSKSMQLLCSTLKFFNLAHAIVLPLAAYIVFTGVSLLKYSFWITIPISISLCVLLMLFINGTIFKPLQKRGTASWQMMMASLGLYIALQNIVSMIWGDKILSFRTWEIKAGHEFFGAFITDIQIATILTCAILLVLCWLFIENTIIGRRIVAISSNAELGDVLGISREKVVTWTISLGTGLAACAGIFIAADFDMTPTMGFNWMLFAVVVMIISGTGKTRHLLASAFFLATAQHLVAYYFDSKWMNAVAYIFLIIFLIISPSGFSGRQIKKVDL